ncbi:hypothetical protein CEXT_700941 [Caerostris extrusa]|uniref:Secreted protein n=1 Tax=Caerostris extrusa TaxID=172846 RepID=A0AAV4X889_CAEEX|nr:hypothetical protein CEXT_700941 [Caerostris extrusa]
MPNTTSLTWIVLHLSRIAPRFSWVMSVFPGSRFCFHVCVCRSAEVTEILEEKYIENMTWRAYSLYLNPMLNNRDTFNRRVFQRKTPFLE